MLCFDRIVCGRRFGLLFVVFEALRAPAAWRRVAAFSNFDKAQVVNSQCDDFSSPLICARFSGLRGTPRERGNRVAGLLLKGACRDTFIITPCCAKACAQERQNCVRLPHLRTLIHDAH